MSPSTFTEFARKIKESGWTKRHIRRKFVKQVDKGDYDKSELNQLLNWMATLALKNSQISSEQRVNPKKVLRPQS